MEGTFEGGGLLVQTVQIGLVVDQFAGVVGDVVPDLGEGWCTSLRSLLA